MLFDSWEGLARIAGASLLAYAAMVAVIRVSGKRTLAKFNAFDLIVTVALGSTLATIILGPDVPLAEGVLAIAALVALQFLVAWTSGRSSRFQQLVKARPSALVHGGEVLEAQLRRTRVTREEVLAAVRTSGHGDLADIAVVVLETDGTLSVIPVGEEGNRSALANVGGLPR